MTHWLDNLLNRITMYRLLLYVLMAYVAVAALFGLTGTLSYPALSVSVSAVFLVAACWLVNRVFAWAYHAPPHNISAYLTGLILALIITPYRTAADLPIFIWAPILAMAAKYIMAIHRQHIFNPAALAVVLTSLAIGKSASWWIASAPMLPVVLIGGILMARKIRRFQVALLFLATSLTMTLFYGISHHTNIVSTLREALVLTPLLFFSTIMLNEPSTMPPTKKFRLLYAVTIGFLSGPQVHLGSTFATPELALLTGNLLFYVLARRERFVLRLQEQRNVAMSTMEYVFQSPRKFSFSPGQYLEWTLPHHHADSRGQRRYFTIASSPTEPGLRIGVKFYPKPSSYKETLSHLKTGDEVVAGQIDGDFTLPKNPKQQLVFVAGGIGVTPFRSMIKYLLDMNQPRPITMFSANLTVQDIAYRDVFDQAEQKLGIRTVYVLTDEPRIPSDWTGRRGFLNARMIEEEVPDYADHIFYLSGPQAMVKNYEHLLASMGVSRSHIKTDYFPGFA
ncbi:MAG: oxidoreductase [Candidatus Kerfeldbacteria bacterium]|nr:oxidoreductase [Candidatus Kerfeldbacteria bacterium]